MPPRFFWCTKFLESELVMVASLCQAAPPPVPSKAKLTVFEATLEEQGQKTPELSTNQFKAFLARRAGVVFDARTDREFALNAYPNSSFFGGTYRELKRAKFFSERKPSPSNPDGLTR